MLPSELSLDRRDAMVWRSALRTQSSQIEFADWLGVIGTTRRHGTFFFHKIRRLKNDNSENRANPRLKSHLLSTFAL
jgi:hypothetical protein